MDDRIKVHVCKYPDRANLVLLYKDPLTGKHVTKSAKTTSERNALKAAGEWEDQLRTGRYAAPSRVTWADFREKYENEVLVGLAYSTRHKYGCTLDVVERVLNPQRVRDITTERLSYLQGEVRKGQKLKGRNRRPVAPATVDGYMRTVKSILSHAVDWGYLPAMPKVRREKRAAAESKAKGRPLVLEEFERLLAVVPDVLKPRPNTLGVDKVTPWRHYLTGLWLSGLRLGESLDLYWDAADCTEGPCLVVDMDGKRPMLTIPASRDKGKRERTLAITPDFAAFLAQTPPEQRRGRVFNPVAVRRHENREWRSERVSKAVSAMGRKAGIIVNTEGKCASVHDLRRSFGKRWAPRVMPHTLKQMMRHRRIETTLEYYATADADAVAEILWADSVNNSVNIDQSSRRSDNSEVAASAYSE